MNRRPRRQVKQDKHAKLKLAAIPVLLIVLAYVVWDGFSGDKKQTLPPPQLANATAPRAPASPQQLAATPISKPPKPRDFPSVDIAALKSRNPFGDYRLQEKDERETLAVGSQSSATVPANPIAEIQRTLANQPVTYRFESAKRKVLVVGDQLIEAGRQLSDHVQVEDIQADHIILTRKGPAAPAQQPAKFD